MFFAIVSKQMGFMMSVDDFYVFFVRLFSKIMFPQKHHFSKGLGGVGGKSLTFEFLELLLLISFAILNRFLTIHLYLASRIYMSSILILVQYNKLLECSIPA